MTFKNQYTLKTNANYGKAKTITLVVAYSKKLFLFNPFQNKKKKAKGVNRRVLCKVRFFSVAVVVVEKYVKKKEL